MVTSSRRRVEDSTRWYLPRTKTLRMSVPCLHYKNWSLQFNFSWVQYTFMHGAWITIRIDGRILSTDSSIPVSYDECWLNLYLMNSNMDHSHDVIYSNSLQKSCFHVNSWIGRYTVSTILFGRAARCFERFEVINHLHFNRPSKYYRLDVISNNVFYVLLHYTTNFALRTQGHSSEAWLNSFSNESWDSHQRISDFLFDFISNHLLEAVTKE